MNTPRWRNSPSGAGKTDLTEASYFSTARCGNRRKTVEVANNESRNRKQRARSLKARRGPEAGEARSQAALSGKWTANNQLAWQIMRCRYREHKTAMPDRNAPDEPEEIDRDLIDALGYILLSDPGFINPNAGEVHVPTDLPELGLLSKIAERAR